MVSLRVGVIGNMNNNNFATMRHLRDIGVDAQLLLYSNEAEHFYPQHDTWQWDRWSPYVRQLGVSNGGSDALLASPRKLRREFDGFDVYMGNGIAPVLFDRMGTKLDLFVPYGEGVEFIIEHAARWRRPLSSGYSWLRKTMMESALRRSVKLIGTANQHAHSQNTYRRLDLHPINLPVLALYPETRPDTVALQPGVDALVERMHSSNLVVFSHVSQIWKKLPVPHFMGGVGKRNDWLVRGFAQYRETSGNDKALLCLFEYGPDVDETRALVRQLGIQHQVAWFPMMSRRDIMSLLEHADIGGSEFAGMYWGGCGWEFLASGVPMLHQLNDAERYRATEYGLPPFFNVHSPDDIAQVLLDHDRAALRRTGQGGRDWFDTHHGRALARRYVELLTQLRSTP